MYYIQTNKFLMQPLGIKRYILCVLGCHKVSVCMRGIFQNSIVLETGECKHFENIFGHFVFINKPFCCKCFEDCG